MASLSGLYAKEDDLGVELTACQKARGNYTDEEVIVKARSS